MAQEMVPREVAREKKTGSSRLMEAVKPGEPAEVEHRKSDEPAAAQARPEVAP